MTRQASSRALTRRTALRLIGAGAALGRVTACGTPQQQPAQPPAAGQQPAGQQSAAAEQPAGQQAPAAGGQKASLRWFFWTGTEEERQFWEGLAADAMQKVPNVEVK